MTCRCLSTIGILALSAFVAPFFSQTASAMEDTATGRWLTRDPIGYADGMNLYEYLRSSTISLVDPIGFSGVPPHKDATQIAIDTLLKNLKALEARELELLGQGIPKGSAALEEILEARTRARLLLKDLVSRALGVAVIVLTCTDEAYAEEMPTWWCKGCKPTVYQKDLDKCNDNYEDCREKCSELYPPNKDSCLSSDNEDSRMDCFKNKCGKNYVRCLLDAQIKYLNDHPSKENIDKITAFWNSFVVNIRCDGRMKGFPYEGH